MATIELTTSRVNLMSDKYLTLKGYISAFKTSNETMKTSTFLFDDCICNAETIRNNIQITVDKQETELTSIDGLIEETDEFFDLVLSKDEEVANEIENRKDDFYEEYDYLKPDCEKSSWENFWEGTAEWCAEHWDIITVVLVVLAVIVLTVVAVVTFGAGAVALVALVGAIVGVASQLAGDILNFIATGDWESSFVDYVGAALGGAVGGIVTLLSGGNAYLAGVTDSAVSSLFSNSVENITGIESHTFGEMMLDTTLSVGLSLACTFCFDKLTTKMTKNLAKSNPFKRLAGRNSYSASFKSAVTKLTNGTQKKFTMKTIRNGVFSDLAGSSFSTVFQGLFGGVQERYDERSQSAFEFNPTFPSIMVPEVSY